MLVIGSLAQYQYRKEFALYMLSGPFIKKSYRIVNFSQLRLRLESQGFIQENNSPYCFANHKKAAQRAAFSAIIPILLFAWQNR